MDKDWDGWPLKLRNFFKPLTDHNDLIKDEKQPFKSVIYYLIALVIAQVVFITIAHLFKGHSQVDFDMVVASFIIDMVFPIFYFFGFTLIYYFLDRDKN